ncbi:unnamed protein product [Schistosoma margrebowiei]|uniref:Uncharacterized protein n=1 Tax=Schistosoma margrebowiei TaxID=48269 RepID=A0A183N606_9TREM|nr:unnamed protein product [Schistosoma margrebowiei]
MFQGTNKCVSMHIICDEKHTKLSNSERNEAGKLHRVGDCCIIKAAILFALNNTDDEQRLIRLCVASSTASASLSSSPAFLSLFEPPSGFSVFRPSLFSLFISSSDPGDGETAGLSAL